MENIRRATFCGCVRPAPAPHGPQGRSPQPVATGVTQGWLWSGPVASECRQGQSTLGTTTSFQPRASLRQGRGAGLSKFSFCFVCILCFFLHWRFDRGEIRTLELIFFFFCHFHKCIPCFTYRIIDERNKAVGRNEWNFLLTWWESAEISTRPPPRSRRWLLGPGGRGCAWEPGLAPICRAWGTCGWRPRIPAAAGMWCGVGHQSHLPPPGPCRCRGTKPVQLSGFFDCNNRAAPGAPWGSHGA